MSRIKQIVQTLDEYVNDEQSGPIKCMNSLLDIWTAPQGSSSSLLHYGRMAFRSAVEIRRYQIKRRADHEGVDLNDSATSRLLLSLGYNRVAYHAISIYWRSTGMEPVLWKKIGKDDHLFRLEGPRFSWVSRSRTSRFDPEGAAYLKGSEADLLKYVRDDLWSRFPDGASLHQEYNIMRGATEHVIVSENLNPTAGTVDDSGAGQRAHLTQRIQASLDAGLPRTILLAGLPGTGKSTFARSVCSQFCERKLLIKPQFLGDDFVEDSVRLLRPDVILMDDVDRSDESLRFLQFLESFESRPKLMFLTVNSIHKMDGAILRPGRVDEVHVMQMPSAEFRIKMIRSLWPSATPEVEAALVSASEGFTPAEVHELTQSVQHVCDAPVMDAITQEAARLRSQRKIFDYFEEGLPGSQPETSEPPKKKRRGKKAQPPVNIIIDDCLDAV
jgi:hypothetical protein